MNLFVSTNAGTHWNPRSISAAAYIVNETNSVGGVTVHASPTSGTSVHYSSAITEASSAESAHSFCVVTTQNILGTSMDASVLDADLYFQMLSRRPPKVDIKEEEDSEDEPESVFELEEVNTTPTERFPSQSSTNNLSKTQYGVISTVIIIL